MGYWCDGPRGQYGIMNTNYHLLFKYIFLGDANCGKSSLLMRFIEGKFAENYESTLGVEFGSKVFQTDHTIVKAMIWDTAGQESFRSIIRSYYKCAIVAILVYDATNLQSFKNVARWLEDIREHGNEFIRVVLVCNKTDVVERRVVSREEGIQVAAEEKLRYWECSAKSGLNVQQIFVGVAQELIKDIQARRLVVNSGQDIGIKIGNPQATLERESVQITLKRVKDRKEKCSC